MGRASGTIITFYSYKGGTGRSMAVANTAWILASNGFRVLAVDWDLEAPGLHRYFHPFLPDKDLRLYRGIANLVWDFATAAVDTDMPSEPGWHEELAQISPYAMSLDYEFPDGGTIDFVPAGRQDSSYSALVTSFDWENFYERLGGGRFLEALKRNMRERYDYVLVDSRTGLSDIAGICTVQLPDILVNCFSLSTQAIDGAAAVAASVGRQRREGQIRIFPVPMRVEDGEQDKLDAARDYSRACFGKYLSHITNPDRYWGEVEVPYKSFYAYEEILAAIGDRPQQQNTILSATERIVGYLTDQRVTALEASPPESERRALLARFQRSAPAVPDSDWRLAGVTPQVFIAYANESAEHFEAVRELWFLLRTRGVDARMDLPPDQRPPNWSNWFLEQLTEADLVLVAVSPTFKRYAELEAVSADDRGPGPEAFLVRDSRDRIGDRILPVVLPGGSTGDIPGFITDVEWVTVDELSGSGIEKLLRRVLWHGMRQGAQVTEPAAGSLPRWEFPKPVSERLRARMGVLAALVTRGLAEASSLGTPLLPVQWSTVASGLADDPAQGMLPPRGHFDDLVNGFLAVPCGKLLILGEPGSGKSTLAIRLASAVLSRCQDGPVPLLLPARSWQPDRESLDSWMLRELRRNYPEFVRSLDRPEIENLVAAGSILPVVDGLDELPLFPRAEALSELSLSPSPLIVTCRSAECREVSGRRFPGSTTVIEVEPLSVADIIKSLSANDPEDGRWTPVFSHLRSHRNSVLAEVLSRPVMLRVVQDAYSTAEFDPTELINPKLNHRWRLGRHLFDLFITATYPSARPDDARSPDTAYNRAAAVRWLAFLARSMHREGTNVLAWWHRDNRRWSTPARIRAVMLGTAVGLLGNYAVGVLGAANQTDQDLVAGGVAILVSLFALLVILLGPPKRPSEPPTRSTRTELPALSVLYLLPRPPAGPSRMSSPRASLHADRTMTAISALVWAIPAVGILAAVTALAEIPIASVIVPAVVLAIGAIGIRLSTSAWGWYTVTRLWLAARGRLPWRLMRFLDDAHRRGVLRQSGAVYQFRYPELQEYLADLTVTGSRR